MFEGSGWVKRGGIYLLKYLFLFYLFVWLCHLLLAAREIFGCSVWGVSSPTRDLSVDL